MAIDDPIVDEVRRARQAYAAQFNGDIRAMFQDIQARQRASGRQFISKPFRPVAPPDASPATADSGDSPAA